MLVWEKCRNRRTCIFDHDCREADCKLGEECEHLHTPNDGKEQRKKNMKDRNRTSKKEVICKFYKNCREGESCEYYHPEVQKERKSKNGESEMQETLLHFLMKEIREVREEMKGMTQDLRRKR